MVHIPEKVRHFVHERASERCEYCLLPGDISYIAYEIDHIYAIKHGGPSTEDNLCLSCSECNRSKGSDLCSLDPETGRITVLYHPRYDTWSEHFRLDGPTIVGITPQGRTTVRLLGMNDPYRISDRRDLIEMGLFP